MCSRKSQIPSSFPLCLSHSVTQGTRYSLYRTGGDLGLLNCAFSIFLLLTLPQFSQLRALFHFKYFMRPPKILCGRSGAWIHKEEDFVPFPSESFSSPSYQVYAVALIGFGFFSKLRVELVPIPPSCMFILVFQDLKTILKTNAVTWCIFPVLSALHCPKCQGIHSPGLLLSHWQQRRMDRANTIPVGCHRRPPPSSQNQLISHLFPWYDWTSV